MMINNNTSIIIKFIKKFLLPKLGILILLWMYWVSNEGGFLLNSKDNNESVNTFKIAQYTMQNVALDLSASELKLGSRRGHSLTQWRYPHNQILLSRCVSKHKLESILIKNGFTIDDPNTAQYYQSFCKDNFEFDITNWESINNQNEYCGYITFALRWDKNKECVKP